MLAFVAPMSTAYALWSRTATASLAVAVAPTPPAAPAIDCGSYAGNGQYTITWTNVSGLTYTVHRSTTTNADASFTQLSGTWTSPYTASVTDGTTTFWRVRASNGSTSGWSNTVRLVRSGSGNGSITCTKVSP